MTAISYTERSASTSFPQTRSFVSRWFGSRWLLNAMARFAERVQRQRAVSELQALDDRLLHDLGVARCEIWYRVNHPQDR